MASLFIYLASRGGGLFSTFLNYLVPKFLINALGSQPSEFFLLNYFKMFNKQFHWYLALADALVRCIRDYAVILGPVRSPLTSASCFLRELFCPQLLFFSLPPPKLGLLRIGQRRKLGGGKYITAHRWLMLQLIVLPSLVPIQNFVQPMIKCQLLQSSHRKSW